jgi:hypothetical protein
MSQSLPAPFPIQPAAAGDRAALRQADAEMMDGTNAVGRTIAELEILLTPLLAGETAHSNLEIRRWPLRQTMALILVSCGVFWMAAAYAVWSIL